jgi:hypothetical protein
VNTCATRIRAEIYVRLHSLAQGRALFDPSSLMVEAGKIQCPCRTRQLQHLLSLCGMSGPELTCENRAPMKGESIYLMLFTAFNMITAHLGSISI